MAYFLSFSIKLIPSLMMSIVHSLQIAESIDIKSFRQAYKAEPIYSDSDELFYKADDDQYIYIFRYGIVCFLNYEESKVKAFVKDIVPYCKNTIDYSLTEEFIIETNPTENKFGHNKVEVMNQSADVLRLIMLNVSQSVALDYYSGQSQSLLTETTKHTEFLERRGKLDISGGRLKRFIGKTLNLKNRITENLYIFDSTEETWEDENLYKIDVELKKTFDLQSRYRNIQEELSIVRENLSLLIDLMHQRKSSTLEVVVIILIMVEVINIFLEKIF
jgi:required for meiotic nuclear division protein 1